MMTLQQLRALVAINDEGSLNHAAERVFLTRSAISKCVKELERSVGIELFDRTPKGLLPNCYGKTLLTFAYGILENVAAARHSIDALRKQQVWELNVGVTPLTSLLPLLAESCGRVSETSNGSHLVLHEISADEAARKVSQGLLDFALTGAVPQAFPDLEIHPICDLKCVVVVHASQQTVLADHSASRAGSGSLSRWVMVDECVSDPSIYMRYAGCATAAPNIVNCASMGLALNLAQTSHAAMIVPERLLAEHPLREQFTVAVSGAEVPSTPINMLVKKRSALNPAATRLYEDIMRSFSAWSGIGHAKTCAAAH
ncbi:LysR family transcriptional regulator [Herbaspirillum sp. RTI4]|uniref:LysR family transcriptional regulator n=1 Tax=Herbaspirillum sp. RTI4 TaxID=3048640 RepID=UPI002AB38577|nr:LysR family transcriptional regulator [Herbaspirillum sp. RTI4]MDY7577168.1 LysR family transcriptional regulator [Herbaspirillum sp. RTI4]MEA9980458.1 LysR family transcriptional regulator [Herbaspirillum sp. RTI4]